MRLDSVTRLHLSQFDDESLSREYREAVKVSGKIVDGWVVIETERLNALKRQYGRSLPSLPAQIANAASAASRVLVAAVAQEQVLADDLTIEFRRCICQSCLELRERRCTRCGCYCAAKIRIRTERCPLGKW